MVEWLIIGLVVGTYLFAVAASLIHARLDHERHLRAPDYARIAELERSLGFALPADPPAAVPSVPKVLVVEPWHRCRFHHRWNVARGDMGGILTAYYECRRCHLRMALKTFGGYQPLDAMWLVGGPWNLSPAKYRYPQGMLDFQVLAGTGGAMRILGHSPDEHVWEQLLTEPLTPEPAHEHDWRRVERVGASEPREYICLKCGTWRDYWGNFPGEPRFEGDL